MTNPHKEVQRTFNVEMKSLSIDQEESEIIRNMQCTKLTSKMRSSSSRQELKKSLMKHADILKNGSKKATKNLDCALPGQTFHCRWNSSGSRATRSRSAGSRARR